jgi:hypothetical protein
LSRLRVYPSASRPACIAGRTAYHADYQTTLTEIDRTLCTLPACADLKDDIEGLDCGPFDPVKQEAKK